MPNTEEGWYEVTFQLKDIVYLLSYKDLKVFTNNTHSKSIKKGSSLTKGPNQYGKQKMVDMVNM